MPRHWRLRTEDILEAIGNIEQYTHGINRAEVEADRRTIDATLQNLEIIGEAAFQLPDEVLARYQQIPWIDIRGMRNLIAHG